MMSGIFDDDKGNDRFVYFNTKLEWLRPLFHEGHFCSRFCIDPCGVGMGVQFAVQDKVVCTDDLPESLVVQMKVKFHELMSFVAASCIEAYFCNVKHNCEICAKRDWYPNRDEIQLFDYICCQDPISFENVGVCGIVVSDESSAQIIKMFKGSIRELKRLPVEVREDLFR